MKRRAVLLMLMLMLMLMLIYGHIALPGRYRCCWPM
jgi:hypothetical protein